MIYQLQQVCTTNHYKSMPICKTSDGRFSDPQPITSSIVQGSGIGPTLWLIVESDLHPDRNNCSETPAICHENATCSLVSPEVCVSERPFNYRCICDPGYSGDGEDCPGEMTVSHCTRSCSQDFLHLETKTSRGLGAYVSRPR